jgi:hypothetical protein
LSIAFGPKARAVMIRSETTPAALQPDAAMQKPYDSPVKPVNGVRLRKASPVAPTTRPGARRAPIFRDAQDASLG